MDFHAAQRLFSPHASEALLRACPGSKAAVRLALYLKVGHFMSSAFLDPDLKLEQRIYRKFYARFVLEGWQRDLKAHVDNYNVKEVFVSSNLFDCVVLNADSLLAWSSTLCEHLPYAPSARCPVSTSSALHARTATATRPSPSTSSLRSVADRRLRLVCWR